MTTNRICTRADAPNLKLHEAAPTFSMLRELTCSIFRRHCALLPCRSFTRPSMATLDEIFAPPACVRGMTSLDRSVFNQRVITPAVRTDPRQCSRFLARLSQVTLRYPGVKRVQKCSNGEDGQVVSMRSSWHRY